MLGIRERSRVYYQEERVTGVDERSRIDGIGDGHLRSVDCGRNYGQFAGIFEIISSLPTPFAVQ
uniref:Uncharacterized protein n=1 Tax=Pristionchus pacificus TaxID=54126 RepID=A0A2A6BIZ1_PRIPA|eukprot:PDM65796.1 hypothetical protein PRIPAC_45197 [Pristionchus pacificus]